MPKLDESDLSKMQFESETGRTLAEVRKETLRVALVLEAGYGTVRVYGCGRIIAGQDGASGVLTRSDDSLVASGESLASLPTFSMREAAADATISPMVSAKFESEE